MQVGPGASREECVGTRTRRGVRNVGGEFLR